MKVEILVPIYKDLEALSLILDSLKKQTYKDFAVTICEDDNAEETKIFLNNYKSNLNIKHISQKDNGNNKAVILNTALKESKADYIIFIDGDTIPFTTFVDAHIKLSKNKTILCGRRVNLGDKVSQDLREQKIKSFEIEKNYLKLYRYLTLNGTRHYEQGIYLKPNSLIQKLVSKTDKNIHILGSNFSCFKKDIEYINGFDEDITGGSKDDVDLEWRFLMSGCKLASVKFCANLFHLNHSRNDRTKDEEIAKIQMEKNKNIKRFICKNGINKL